MKNILWTSVTNVVFSADQENAVFADFKNATLRNKNELQKENNKLSAEIEKVCFLIFPTLSNRM